MWWISLVPIVSLLTLIGQANPSVCENTACFIPFVENIHRNQSQWINTNREIIPNNSNMMQASRKFEHGSKYSHSFNSMESYILEFGMNHSTNWPKNVLFISMRPISTWPTTTGSVVTRKYLHCISVCVALNLSPYGWKERAYGEFVWTLARPLSTHLVCHAIKVIIMVIVVNPTFWLFIIHHNMLSK